MVIFCRVHDDYLTPWTRYRSQKLTAVQWEKGLVYIVV